MYPGSMTPPGSGNDFPGVGGSVVRSTSSTRPSPSMPTHNVVPSSEIPSAFGSRPIGIAFERRAVGGSMTMSVSSFFGTEAPTEASSRWRLGSKTRCRAPIRSVVSA